METGTLEAGLNIQEGLWNKWICCLLWPEFRVHPGAPGKKTSCIHRIPCLPQDLRTVPAAPVSTLIFLWLQTTSHGSLSGSYTLSLL